MILMTLDHTRDFFGTGASPTNPATATVALFFTRWVTHLCAPSFFLLTGAGAYLARHRRIDEGALVVVVHARRLVDRAGADRGPLPRVSVQLRLSRDDAGHPVGVGVGDDHAGGAGPPADAGDCGVRRRADCLAQSVRLGDGVIVRRLRAALAHPACHGCHRLDAEVCRLCRLPDRAVDRRDGGGIRARPGIQLAARAAAGFSAAPGRHPDPGVRHPAAHEFLRRSDPLDLAAIRPADRAVVPEHDQVPAVAAVPVDDAWTRRS